MDLCSATTTNLLECTHDWIIGLGCYDDIDLIFTAFSVDQALKTSNLDLLS